MNRFSGMSKYSIVSRQVVRGLAPYLRGDIHIYIVLMLIYLNLFVINFIFIETTNFMNYFGLCIKEGRTFFKAVGFSQTVVFNNFFLTRNRHI